MVVRPGPVITGPGVDARPATLVGAADIALPVPLAGVRCTGVARIAVMTAATGSDGGRTRTLGRLPGHAE